MNRKLNILTLAIVLATTVNVNASEQQQLKVKVDLKSIAKTTAESLHKNLEESEEEIEERDETIERYFKNIEAEAEIAFQNESITSRKDFFKWLKEKVKSCEDKEIVIVAKKIIEKFDERLKEVFKETS